MVDTPFTTFAFDTTLGTSTRTMPDRLDDVLSVKEFGATGNGSTDDTAAIQACFDAAFGTWASPHGISGQYSNRPVYFPPGNYKVNPASSLKTVSGTVSDGGSVRLTLDNTTGLVNGDIVYVRGVGGTTHANGSWTIKNVDSTHITLNNCIYVGSWTSGGTVRAPALRIKDCQGARIFGAGKGASRIQCGTTNCATISVNGFGYSRVSDLEFGSDAGGIAFDLNGDGLGAVSSQSDYFDNCSFGGSASTNGDYAVTIGFGQQMGSEMTFMDCYVAAGDIAGLRWSNQNALSGTVIGGNIGIGGNPSSGRIGIWVVGGACPVIHGVGFQMQAGIDIAIDTDGGYSIVGCRSESQNFVRGPALETQFVAHISGCTMTSPAAPGTGFFYKGGGLVTIEGCYSVGGYGVTAGNARMCIRNCDFTDATYLTDIAGYNPAYLEVIPQRLLTESTTSRSNTNGMDASARVQFTSGSASTYTVLNNSDTTTRLVAGSWMEVQQYGAGQVTITPGSGVSLHSANGLKTRAQYSVVRITADSTLSHFTVSGDTTT